MAIISFMASKTVTTLIDDLDGSEIQDGKGGSVRFSLDGRNYSIDLTDKNEQKLRDALKPYIDAAAVVSNRPPSGGARTSVRASSGDLDAARTWLRENGHQVGDRGRIKAELLDLYRSSK